MFTGIVEELGEVVGWEELADAARLTVKGPLVTSDAKHGDSIAVNGVCLTVVDHADGAFTADVMQESLDRSSPGRPRRRAAASTSSGPCALQDRLGGHLVQGHVDGTGEIVGKAARASTGPSSASRCREDLDRYVVEKGSITVDGISLTVSAVATGWFEVSLIPTTLELTTLGRKGPGDPVNLEVDITAKYVEKLLPGARHDPDRHA